MATSINERALSLLGSGVPAEAVASAVGVTAGYISQLLSNEEFAEAVTQLRFASLSRHTERDAGYDDIETSLIEKLKKSLPLMLRPVDILGAIKVINGAKRRGQDSQESLIGQQDIVNITMPIQIIQTFTTNINNQVVKTGDTDLLTIQSGELLKQAETPVETLAIEQKEDTGEDMEDFSALEGNTLLASL